MSKPVEDLSFDELVDWAAGHILQELIKGNLRNAVWFVLQRTIEWKETH